MTTAIILAGGFGTRLAPLLGDLTKPMMPVAGRPFVEHLTRYLVGQGVDEIVISLGFRADVTERWLARSPVAGVRIRTVTELTPLGTGGAMRLASAETDATTLLVLNGDSFCPVDVRHLAASHRRHGAEVTLALAHVPDRGRYGAVEQGPDGTVTAFREKVADHIPGLINAGVYMVNRSVLDAVTPGVPVSFEREVLPALAPRAIRGEVTASYFIDIGTVDDYRSLSTDPRPFLRWVAGDDGSAMSVAGPSATSSRCSAP